MKLYKLFLLLIISCPLFSNPVAVGSSTPEIDYLRGTIGEPLSFNGYQLTSHGTIQFNNELKFQLYPNDVDFSGSSYNIKLIDIFSLDFGFKQFDIGVRIPYIFYLSDNISDSISTHKLSDILIKARYEPFTDPSNTVRFNFGFGIKFPTGNDIEEDPLPSSPGSQDYIMLTNFSVNNKKNFILNAHFGCAFMDKVKRESRIRDTISNRYKIIEYKPRNVYNLCIGCYMKTKQNVYPGLQLEFISQLSQQDINSEYNIQTGIAYLSTTPIAVINIPEYNLSTEMGVEFQIIAGNIFRSTNFFIRFCWNNMLFS